MTIWKFLTSHNSPGVVHGDEAHIPHKSCSDPSTCASRVSDSYISEKTRKFSPTCVHLDVKNCNYDHSLCLSLVHRASDRMRRYGTGYFANIRIRIIRTLFHKNIKKLCNISDKAASLQTQKQKFRSDIGYFK